MTTNTRATEAPESERILCAGRGLRRGSTISQPRARGCDRSPPSSQRPRCSLAWARAPYYAAYGMSYGLVFSGVFLKELLPASNPLRRGFEDGAAAAARRRGGSPVDSIASSKTHPTS